MSESEKRRLLFIADVQARIRRTQLNAADAGGALMHLATIAPLAVDQAVTAAEQARKLRRELATAEGKPHGSRRQRKRAAPGS